MNIFHFQKYRPFRSGYSLIELILVIALMAILFVAGIQSVTSTTSQVRFQNTSEQIISLIREARSLAIAGKAQLDYTDFDKDGINDQTASGGPDAVIPAHYGIHFIHTDNPDQADKVILFVDNHSVAGQGSEEGNYDPLIQTPEDYRRGYDLILSELELPGEIRLHLQNNATSTIFYSTPYADITFDPPLQGDNFFHLQIEQAGSVQRLRCYNIHKLSGILEPQSDC